MKKSIFIMILAVVGVITLNCGGTQDKTAENIDPVPSWFGSPPASTENVLYGVANSSSEELKMAVEKAKHLAKKDLISKLEKKRENEDSEITEKQISPAVNLEKQKITENKQQDKQYSVYVLMKLDLNKAKDLVK